VRLSVGGGRTALLTYCANVHPGERLDDVWAALDAAADVRARLQLDRMAIGMWLSRPALDELLAGAEAGRRLAGELARRDLEVFTFNGFPYGNFHAPVVKRAVYHPDWSTAERSAYTLALAEILAEVLAPGIEEGTISTLPLAHRDEVVGPGVEQAALDRLCRLAIDLARLADRTGRRVRVVCEPEPGCLLESTADAIQWWTVSLPAAARRTGTPPDVIAAHLGLCFDTCHQAVAFEDPRASLDALAAAGVPIGKMQLSSSLVVPAPGTTAGQSALQRFAEPRFLHQVRACGADGVLAAADDLDRTDGLPDDRPWRVHFHVPIHRAAVGEVETTREFLRGAMAWLRAPGRPLPHLEVETYTWSVLPESERPADTASLCAGLAAELAWARRELAGAGQEPGAP
jgi:sugar phosphate isomerase/epimerase